MRNKDQLYNWCKRCVSVKMHDYYRRPEVRAKRLAYLKKYNKKRRKALTEANGHNRRLLRAQFIAAYGGECACCRENRSEFMTLDHIRGDGAVERRRGIDNYMVIRRLRRMGWPKGEYRVLCFNCNIAISVFGACPHSIEPDVLRTCRVPANFEPSDKEIEA